MSERPIVPRRRTAWWIAGLLLLSVPRLAAAWSGTPFRDTPLGLAAALAPASDPAQALRGASIVGVTPQPDSSVVVEARTARGRLVRFTLPASGWREVARQFAAPAVAEGRRAGASEGRGSLVLYQTLLGLGYYGWAVPKVLHVTDTKGQVGLYMLTASASFGVPYALTRHADVSSADSRLVGYGASRGLGLGLFIDNSVAQERDYSDYMNGDGTFDYERYDRDRTHDEQRKYGLGIAASVAGSLAGYYGSGALGDDPARCEFVGACGDYGAALGIATAYTLGLYDDSPSHRHARGALGVATFGAGIASGVLLSRHLPLGTGDSYVLRDAIVLGAQIGLPIAHALSDDNGLHRGRAVVRGAVLGSIGGLALGRKLIAEDDYSDSDGFLQTAAQAAGGLFALGVGYLVSNRDSLDDGAALTVQAAGSAAGFALMNRALRHRHQTRGTR